MPSGPLRIARVIVISGICNVDGSPGPVPQGVVRMRRGSGGCGTRSPRLNHAVPLERECAVENSGNLRHVNLTSRIPFPARYPAEREDHDLLLDLVYLR